MKFFNKNLSWFTNVHIYGLSLAIGDAYKFIDKIKAGDAYSKYFYNIDGERGDEPEGFINEVDNIIGKTVDCFTLNNSGLSWFPVFDSSNKNDEVDGIYIDYAGAVTTPTWARPSCFHSKEHIKIINNMIEKSLNNKPIFHLSFPSKKILMMETKNKVQFYTEKEIEVDYSQPIDKVFNQLLKISENENLGFINAQCPIKNFTLDFHIDQLSSDKFDVYKVESLVKDIDWYAIYYAKYHLDTKDIYKRKKISKEQEQRISSWLTDQPLGNDMKEILSKAEFDPTAPDVESFKLDIEQHGFLHGYYLKAV